jgi:hypothetical protein
MVIGGLTTMKGMTATDDSTVKEGLIARGGTNGGLDGNGEGGLGGGDGGHNCNEASNVMVTEGLMATDSGWQRRA